MNALQADIPGWTLDLVRCPDSGAALRRDGDRLVRPDGGEVGRVENGILRLPIAVGDDNVRLYRQVGGSHFWERATQAFAMSALDTPVFHRHLEDVAPASRDAVIVDVGGGDGRNALPWLEKDHRRVVVIDAVAEGLARFRSRVADSHPEWLDRLLLIEADARRLPLVPGCAETVTAIESLYYLNDDYEIGLRQCTALLAAGGRLMLAERDHEGGLLLQVLYHGIARMLEAAGTRRVVDGPPDALMVSRCFTEPELLDLLHANGLAVQSVRGTSVFSFVLGWMRNRQLVGDDDAAHLPAIRDLLQRLGRDGRMRRCHVVVAGRRT